ncbi:MAG: hypothetical protein QXZ70_07250 [Candidatus Bathyarchaeia archaeon]
MINMKYIIDLPPDLAKKINILISRGSYENLSDFAITAFQNQLLLEENSNSLAILMGAQHSENKLKDDQYQLASSSILPLNFSPEIIKTVPPPDNNKIPNDCLWGQYNRIFPIKITLRVLANLLKENETIELCVLQTQAVQVAREIGLLLRKEDKKSRRKYGDMLSSALPVGRNITKTENRFINHFVGYYTRAGRIEGAPGALKFLNIFEEADGSYKVGITKTGLDFAVLSNPILDEKNYGLPLSKAESEFYIENVFQNLKREAEVMLAILRAVHNGKSSPSELNEEIAHFSRGWSQAMINTIRAGAISRLHELGLISRERKGTNVTYSLTQFGKEMLATYQQKEGMM